MIKRVSVLGLGYIGLPTAILAAQAGYEVFGFDTEKEKVARINNGDALILEPETTERLWRVLKSETFRAYTELAPADCFIIAVPTPLKDDSKEAQLDLVFQAGDIIAKKLMPGNLVILESTVPVGTTERLAQRLEEHSGLKLGIDFFVTHSPERVMPGRIFRELVENDRIIGGICQQSCELAYFFYSKFVRGFLHVTNDKTAEMTKLIENSYRDVQVAFANQVAEMCSQIDLDPFQVIDLANKHPRVKILSPGCGVGGHCIAIDPWFLVESFPQSSSLLREARAINDQKPTKVLAVIDEKITEAKSRGREKPRVLILGLAFKPNVDDIRQSPALKIALTLKQRSDELDLQCYDHNVNPEQIAKAGIDPISDLWKGINWADIVVILVRHKEFSLIREEAFSDKLIVDACGLFYEMHVKNSKMLLEGATKLFYSASQQQVF
ncbi:MAG: nucleotide sugar dehydrogenase [Candidatus Babeliales bacterium]